MHRSIRLITAACAFAVFAAACASGPTAEERAAAREALLESEAASTPAPTTTATGAVSPTDCVGEECGEPPAESVSPPTNDLEQALAAVADEGLRFQLAAALGLAENAQTLCSDLTAWTGALDEAVAATTTATATALERGGEWLGTPTAATVARAFRDELILQGRCQEGAQAGDIDAAVAAAGRASAANDDIRVALTAGNPATASELWYHADQVGHTIEMQRVLRDEGPVEVLIIGSSTAKRGFDPGVMTAELDQSTVNAAVAGLFPPTIAPWADLALRLSGDPTTVVIGVSTFQDFLECTDDRQTKMADAIALQELAFEPIGALADEEPARLLVGGDAATYQSVVLDEYTPLPGSRGQMDSPDRPNADSVAYYTNLYTPRMENGEYCAQNATAINSLAQALVEDGRQVLIVSLPLSPGMAGLHPDGRTAHDRAIDAYRDVSEATGAGWLDLTDLLADDEFLDLTHATAPGRAKITAATIDALR